MYRIIICLLTVVAFSSCKKDSGSSIQCQNGGTVSGSSCVCSFGYQGTNCQTEVRSQFLGTFDVSLNCSGPLSYVMQITQASGDVTRVNLINLDDQGSSFSALAVLESGNTNALIIPQQTVSGLQFNGNIYATGNPGVFNFSYSISDGSSSEFCSGTLIRR